MNPEHGRQESALKWPPAQAQPDSATVIATRAAAAATGCVGRFGCGERTARAWTDILHTRAQIRAERHLRGHRQ